MPRGGARPGAGRPRKNPAAKNAAPEQSSVPVTGPDGLKPEGAEHWPFGREAPKEPELPQDLSALMPLDYLLQVMRNPEMDVRTRLQAAQLAAPLCHPKMDKASAKSKRAEEEKPPSRFGRRQPPRLVASGGSNV